MGSALTAVERQRERSDSTGRSFARVLAGKASGEWCGRTANPLPRRAYVSRSGPIALRLPLPPTHPASGACCISVATSRTKSKLHLGDVVLIDATGLASVSTPLQLLARALPPYVAGCEAPPRCSQEGTWVARSQEPPLPLGPPKSFASGEW